LIAGVAEINLFIIFVIRALVGIGILVAQKTSPGHTGPVERGYKMSRLRRWALLALGAYAVSRFMSRRKEEAESEERVVAKRKAA